MLVAVAGVGASRYMGSVYRSWVFTSELMFLFVFPQLLLAIWFSKHVNVYGAIAAFVVGVALRLGVSWVREAAWWAALSAVPHDGGGGGDWRGGGGVVGVMVPDCAEGLFMSGLSSRVHAAVLQEVEAGLQVEAEFQGVQGVERV